MKSHIVSVWYRGNRITFLVQSRDETLKLTRKQLQSLAKSAGVKPGQTFNVGA